MANYRNRHIMNKISLNRLIFCRICILYLHHQKVSFNNKQSFFYLSKHIKGVSLLKKDCKASSLVHFSTFKLNSSLSFLFERKRHIHLINLFKIKLVYLIIFKEIYNVNIIILNSLAFIYEADVSCIGNTIKTE